jgi:undecaprenyl-diphosphatase
LRNEERESKPVKSTKSIAIISLALLLFIILTIFVLIDDLTLQYINYSVHDWFASYIVPALVDSSSLIGILTNWYLYAPILLFLLILPRTRFKIGLPMAITVSTSAIVGPIILKNIFAIPRPEIGQLIEASGYGYPSGHSLNSVVFFGMSAIMIHRYSTKPVLKIGFIIFAIVAALIVGTSRLYLGVHTLSDVIGGYLLGIAFICAEPIIENFVRRKLKERNDKKN